jgi:hypothetical protein
MAIMDNICIRNQDCALPIRQIFYFLTLDSFVLYFVIVFLCLGTLSSGHTPNNYNKQINRNSNNDINNNNNNNNDNDNNNIVLTHLLKYETFFGLNNRNGRIVHISPENIQGVDGRKGREPRTDSGDVNKGQCDSSSVVRVDVEWYNPGRVVAPTAL